VGGPLVKKRDFYTHLTPPIMVNPSEFRNAVSFRAISDDCASLCDDMFSHFDTISKRNRQAFCESALCSAASRDRNHNL